MQEKNIRSKDLSNLLNISPAHLSYVLNGKRNISLELAEKISKVLGINMSDLFKDDSEKNETIAFNNTNLDKISTIQKLTFELISNKTYENGDIFIKELAEISEIPENKLIDASQSLEDFALLPIDFQTRILRNIFNVLDKMKTQSKCNKDLMEILEHEKITMKGEVLSAEDLEVIKSALEQGYYLAKKLNKRTNSKS
jgi:transcriptional regulator with XRE-family HTH domain